jgi:hypothetical protein
MTPYQAAIVADLPPHARLLLPILERKAHGYAECWAKNATLCGLLRCCERTIRNALRALEDRGIIAIVRDYSLKSRRRIVLLWKKNRGLFPSMAANTDSQVAANVAPQVSAPPYNPPVSVPDGEEEERGRESTPPPPSHPSGSIPTVPIATPEQVQALATVAAKIIPSATPAWVEKQVGQWSLPWFRAAIAKTAAKGQGRNYLYGILNRFKAEPPDEAELAPPKAPPKTTELEYYVAPADSPWRRRAHN